MSTLRLRETTIVKHNTILDFFNQNIIGFDLHRQLFEPNANIFKDELNLKIDSKVDSEITFIYEPTVEKANSANKDVLEYVYGYSLKKYDDISNKLVLVSFKTKIRSE